MRKHETGRLPCRTRDNAVIKPDTTQNGKRRIRQYNWSAHRFDRLCITYPGN